jgi:hypothetical protein
MAHDGGGGKGVISALLFIFFVGAVIFAFTAFPFPKLPTFESPRSAATSTKARVGGAVIPQKPAPGKTTIAASSAKNKPVPGLAPSPAAVPYDIPAGFTKEQISPYFRKVRLGSISVGGFGQIGQATLSAQLSGSEWVSIAGWRIQGRSGALYMPRAVQVYDALGLAPETDIILRSGDVLYLYSGGTSAIGKNLRLNKCLGYLPTIGDFKPAVPRTCPAIQRDEISNFTGQCQNYIYSLGACGVPVFNDVRIPITDYACKAYLEKLNYRGCLERHGGDKDFLSSQIYGWVGAIPFDQYHDKLRLLDAQGLVVDFYEY